MKPSVHPAFGRIRPPRRGPFGAARNDAAGRNAPAAGEAPLPPTEPPRAAGTSLPSAEAPYRRPRRSNSALAAPRLTGMGGWFASLRYTV